MTTQDSKQQTVPGTNGASLRLFCHPERSEGSAFPSKKKQILRQKTPQNDNLELKEAPLVPGTLHSPSPRLRRMIVRGTRYVLSKNGFTLIEVLLAVALLAVVSTSALSVFSMGLQIWKRSRQSTALERKAVLALEKISQDLREMIRVKPPEEKFSIKEDALFTYGGKSDQVRIPSVLTEATVSGPGGFARKIYWLDHGKKRLCRSVETAADLFRKRPPVCQALAENVTRLRFRYRLPSGITGSFSWYDDWDMEAGLPFGVEIEMEVTPADRGIEKRVFRRSIAIPVAEIEEKK